MIIAIDGPAASGKGTLSRRLAWHYGLRHLDTGRLYRACGMAVLSAGGDPANEEDALAAARQLDPAAIEAADLRSDRAGQAASQVAALPSVRQALLDFQRAFAAAPPGAVLDGRDIGTIVCPEADAKLFITASLPARARRRYQELRATDAGVIYDAVLKDMEERDRRDSGRTVAPLKAAEDALSLDTSDMDADAVFDRAVAYIRSRTGR